MKLCIKDLIFWPKSLEQPILRIKELNLPSGASLCISGESGSGKSTLLNLISALERPNSGEIWWDDISIGSLNSLARDRWRGQNIGLVMQDFHLINELSALNNLLLPSFFGYQKPSSNLRLRARELLKEVGIDDMDKKTSLYSRGQMQRIAVARALLYEPKVLITDEPSASLDRQNSQKLAKLLSYITSQRAITYIVATHDEHFKASIQDQIILKKGLEVEFVC